MIHKVFFIVISIVFFLKVQSESKPWWFEDVNFESCYDITQGEKSLATLVDLGFVKNIPEIFEGRLFYFIHSGSHLFNATQLKLSEPSKYKTFETKTKDHSTAVATLIAGKCIIIPDFNQPFLSSYSGETKSKTCGLSPKAKVLSISDQFDRSLHPHEMPNLSNVIKRALGVDISQVKTINSNSLEENIFPDTAPSVNIINISMGKNDGYLHEILNYLVKLFTGKSLTEVKDPNDEIWTTSKALLVFAAGNVGEELVDGTLDKDYPQFFYEKDNVLIVAATRKDGELTDKSNYSQKYVDIAAPGEGLVIPYGNDELKALETQAESTSFAAPLVSATAALIASCNRSLSAQDIKAIILETSDKVPHLEDKVKDGRKLNVCRAIKKACSGKRRPSMKKPPVKSQKGIDDNKKSDSHIDDEICEVSDFLNDLFSSRDTCPVN